MAAAKTAKEASMEAGQEQRSKTKESGNPLEEIERLLTCPICLDRYKQPKLLPCQHTFCLPCLESYVESTGGRPRLRCPECRAEHGLSLDDGVQALQTNLTLLAFLEIHMEASAANAAEMHAYVQRFNLERCRVCEEKAELELCAHCEKKCCVECRKAHVDMLKRDLGRLLGQVRRLSARVKEASDGLGRGMENLQANGEQTRQEIRDYFNRYQRELKRREEHFLEQADVFVQTEERLMRTLRDALDVEWNNLQDACIWVEAALNGQRTAQDEDLARFKLEFQQGLEYLRSFQPDSEELFAKKLRFAPGDDAAKLPTAIANFGELNVSLPQFANRYLPLEQQYLPRPFRISLESENFTRREREREQQREGNRAFAASGAYRDEEILPSGGQENAGAMRWRRRRELEEEAWARLRGSEGGLRADIASSGTTPTSSSRATPRVLSPLTIPQDDPRTTMTKSPIPLSSPRGEEHSSAVIKKNELIPKMELVKKEMPQQSKAETNKLEKPKPANIEVELKKEVMAGQVEMVQHANQEEKEVDTPEGKGSLAGPNLIAAATTEGAEQIPIKSDSTTLTTENDDDKQTAQPFPAVVKAAPPAIGKQPTGLPQAKPKQAQGSGTSGIPTHIGGQTAGGTQKNVRTEGTPPHGQTRGRLLMVNGPRAATAAGTTSISGASRRPGPHQAHNLHQHGLHPKSQKPPLPVRQQSAGAEEQKNSTVAENRRSTPTFKREGSQKSKDGDDEEEDEEERSQEHKTGETGGDTRGRQQQAQQIKSQASCTSTVAINTTTASTKHLNVRTKPAITKISNASLMSRNLSKK